MKMWLWLSSGLLLGWSLGANNAANVFGAAVASRMLRFTTAATLCAVFVVLGGLVNGPAAMATIGELAQQRTLPSAFLTALAAALVLTVMTRLGMPVSASQALVGAVVGHLLGAGESIQEGTWVLLSAIIFTWIVSPFFSGLLALVVYRTAALCFRRIPMPVLLFDQWLRFGLIAAGSYGAWALGGNNMANVVGVYTNLEVLPALGLGAFGLSQDRSLALLGGLAISLGVVTYSRQVMMTVGRELVRLDAPSALIAMLSHSIVVDFFAHTWNFAWFSIPAIPVSTSEALVGALVGIGLARGFHTVRARLLIKIGLSWVLTPVASLVSAYVFTAVWP